MTYLWIFLVWLKGVTLSLFLILYPLSLSGKQLSTFLLDQDYAMKEVITKKHTEEDIGENSVL